MSVGEREGGEGCSEEEGCEGEGLHGGRLGGWIGGGGGWVSFFFFFFF